MNQDIRNLEPKALWNNFSDLNAVPRASKKEERVITFMVAFGKRLGLETIVDPVQNVIIKKPATSGMENRKTIVMQSHLDMVHQKNLDTNFDFNKEGIKMLIDGDWVKANGTTLGADNGLGVAAIMSVLESKDIPHPAIEALFTIDEETGMTGAMGLQAGYLSGKILLNLDTEDDDEIDIGCAGGIDITAKKTYEEESISGNIEAYQISITGLSGGHSGMDIHKGLGNANKIMNRILIDAQDIIYIVKINGGSLRNAIPRESFATVITSSKDASILMTKIQTISKIIENDFIEIENNLEINVKPVDCSNQAMKKETQVQLFTAIKNAHNGVYKMSEDMVDLVESSNNIAKVTVENGLIQIECLTRSSLEESKKEVSDLLKFIFEKEGFQVNFSGSYPGWQPNPNSPILKVMEDIYTTIFGSKPKVVACHAGLECGILGTNYPTMDMISFGPTIKGAHSPDERASISSTQKFWKYLLEILKNIPIDLNST
ncbi:MAG: aminoacyl-histidine dipeptidase [Flavobacteriaceae bacterium]|nr:aminoacyl-histidine dipeptidase [Flavobacteriaceae bacterium]